MHLHLIEQRKSVPSFRGIRKFTSVAFLTLVVIFLTTMGCGRNQKEQASPNNPQPFSAKLRLLIVGDPLLAKAIGKFQGDWKAKSEGQFDLVEMTEQELIAQKQLEADLIIYPSRQLGLLAERQWIVKLEESKTQTSADVFKLVRLREVVWGRDPMAVPFGSPVLTCFYRPDLLKAAGQKPPETWAEYQHLAELLGDRKKVRGWLADAAPDEDAPWYGAVEPLAEGWAGRVLLARAAAYAKRRSYYSTLFDYKTMEPLIDTEPFVRALTELVAATRWGPPEQEQLGSTPADVRNRFASGHCALALAWPTASKPAATESQQERAGKGNHLAIGFIELPGSKKIFNPRKKKWEDRPQGTVHVPLLALSGRLGSVSKSSKNPYAALSLLHWLAGTSKCIELAAATDAMTLCRQSQTNLPGAWISAQADARAAGQYVASVEAALSRDDALCALRIPGQAKYMAALDEAVHAAVRGTPPSEALRLAAQRWRKITDERGTLPQSRAYQRSLGLEP